MIKLLVLVGIIALGGCASQATKSYYPPDMTNFTTSCKHARTQIDYLNKEIIDYTDIIRIILLP
jgi:uncharacterized lipoprotein YmbA